MKTFLGLDVGGTKCAFVIAHVGGGIRLLDRLSFPSHAEKGFDDMLKRILRAGDEILARNRLTTSDIAAIGISCGGPLDSRTGYVLAPPNLPGWIDIPLTEIMQSHFGLPAFLQNDANACALVEWKLGAGRGTENMIFCTMGTGMGAGVIAEGRLMRGASDMGGEIGHLRLTDDGPVGFGKAGSFEGYVSGGGIALQAKAWTKHALLQGKTPAWIRDGYAEEEISAKLIAEYAKNGDEDALRLYEHIGTMLGRGLSLLVDAFNPEKIVIGSIFARAEALLRPAMEAVLEKECIPYSLKAVQVCPAKTGEQIGDYASIMTALYALDIDPMAGEEETSEDVLLHYEALYRKYPSLSDTRDSVMDAYKALRDCYRREGKLLVCGNGGSCADAEHIVGELMKGFYRKRPIAAHTKNSILSNLQGALPAIALTGHAALSTAFGNDEDPAYVYAQQTYGYGKKGDVLIGISTSGNAKNVINAARTARELGITVIALTGGSGGELKSIADISIIAPGSCPADVQECHLPIYHTLCAMLEAKFFHI